MTGKTASILDVKPESYKKFSCGKIALDEYLKKCAKGNHKKGIGKTFVLKENEIVVGFYTVSMGSIEFLSLPKNTKNGLPRYPIPIARIGRLAVDEKAKGKGIGKFLLVDALYRIREASQSVAAFAVVVNAKDSSSKDFYKYFGFIEFSNDELSLFLPMQTINKLFM